MLLEKNKKWWVLGALAISLLTVGLDLTVLNLALPTLAVQMNASNSELQWFADAYNLVIAALLLPAGLLGDKLGRKKMLLMALLVFGLASIGCAYSDTPLQLIIGRAFLGLGAAFLMPLSMSVIPVLFTEEERPKAIGIWVMANALGIPLGPILGGWLLKNYAWGSVFLINLPIILLGMIALSIFLKESRSTGRTKIDFPGMLLSSFGLVSLTYGFIEAGERGWSDYAVMGPILGGVVLLALFILWQSFVKQPLIDLELFRSAGFTWGSILATVVSFAMFGLLFVTPQYFQAVSGADALGTGVRLLPIVGGLLIGSQIAERLQLNFGAKFTLLAGLSLLALGMFIGANTGSSHGYGFAAIWISIVGLGIGFALPTAMDISMAALTAERSGIGSALIMTMRQIGGTIGVAVLGTMLSSVYRDKLAIEGLSGDSADALQRSVASGMNAARELHSPELLEAVRSAFIHGMDAMLWVVGGVAALGILLTLVFLHIPQSGKEGRSINVRE
ncbi:DHA2 family efflux MFS transporter permease subunit [Paenibacillus sp. MMS20-IR301]|uniref:DHA2 family efflux MFS transporter permease subunit n=1 Tax=Paenibacillus sp. MMS20-IR301 TaxID=2895946 RepID=UPI0028ED5F21|nr:DHA2 family efflux MFS transporter permease subunit [Paenibacillus sp. MMS20-IR301]WNS44871.1 DHA2 family efflux MFS transporter permease subunit [Paenibacillus sp. MMS20-IR301]